MKRNTRSGRSHLLVCGASVLLLSGPVLADALMGSNMILCYGWSAASCDTDAGCEETQPWRLNVPDFIKVDLRNNIATTTRDVEERRQTEIRSVERLDGRIVLQGVQDDRAFSWVITEESGEGTLTVAGAGLGLIVFTVCTPTETL